MSHLTGKKIAFVATNGFEDSELMSPWEAVTGHGATAACGRSDQRTACAAPDLSMNRKALRPL